MEKIIVPHVVNLDYPVEMPGGETITKITFNRRPVTGDLRGVQVERLSDLDQAMTVAVRISDLPVAAKSKVDAADGIKVAEVIAGFLEPGL